MSLKQTEVLINIPCLRYIFEALVHMALFICAVNACAPTAPMPTTTTSTTTTTTTTTTTLPPLCVTPSGNAAIIFNMTQVMQNDTQFGYNNFMGNNQTAPFSGQCPCTSGATQFYYNGSTVNDWAAYMNASAPNVMTLTCATRNNFSDMCLCASDTECYSPNATGMAATLVPFCQGTSCDVYMFATGGPNSAFVRTVGTGPPITLENQVINGSIKLLPDEYSKIKSISCAGCPAPSTTCMRAP